MHAARLAGRCFQIIANPSDENTLSPCQARRMERARGSACYWHRNATSDLGLLSGSGDSLGRAKKRAATRSRLSFDGFQIRSFDALYASERFAN